MFPWISSNFCPPNLLLVRSHQEETTIIVNACLNQGRNDMTTMRVLILQNLHYYQGQFKQIRGVGLFSSKSSGKLRAKILILFSFFGGFSESRFVEQKRIRANINFLSRRYHNLEHGLRHFVLR